MIMDKPIIFDGEVLARRCHGPAEVSLHKLTTMKARQGLIDERCMVSKGRSVKYDGGQYIKELKELKTVGPLARFRISFSRTRGRRRCAGPEFIRILGHPEAARGMPFDIGK